MSKAHVIVIKKAKVRGRARQNADVARSGHALIPIEPNVLDAFKPLTNRCRLIRGRIIDDDDLDITSG